jgi:hypothetical protein
VLRGIGCILDIKSLNAVHVARHGREGVA